MKVLDTLNTSALLNDSIEYYAIAYYRLSKDDKGKNESDSIANQRKLISAFLEKHPNIKLVAEADDDGYTGTNFNRPGFCAVMDAIEQKKVNCVIVKDLSRLGREYIQMGRYLEEIFPSLGIRFIAINDDVDSSNSKDSDDIIIPIKNIMNESYCRLLSKNLRKQFRIQRSNGEFIGNFASYGYIKSDEDKHKLVVDEYAAEVVKGIFSLKIRGYSQNGIADFLNSEQILPPAEYKKSIGLSYKSGFKGTSQYKWSAVAVTRILTNPLYIGTLVQGKRGTANYKIKKMKYRDEDDWIVVQNNHPAIVDPLVFYIVGRLLERDTRRSPNSKTVNPLAGVLYCADCERAMVLRTVTRSEKKFYYYVCSSFKNRKTCTIHNFEQSRLEGVVMNAITNQIKLVIELDELLNEVGHGILEDAKLQRIDVLISQKMKDIDRCKDMRMNLYEAYNDNLINREEYDKMRQKYTTQLEAEEAALCRLREEYAKEQEISSINTEWIQEFKRFQGVTELTRELVVTLIDKVYVYEDKRVKIEFNYRNELEYIYELIEEKTKEVG
jgi:DNA invertase Pin-like site-specific DNA recombinase